MFLGSRVLCCVSFLCFFSCMGLGGADDLLQHTCRQATSGHLYKDGAPVYQAQSFGVFHLVALWEWRVHRAWLPCWLCSWALCGPQKTGQVLPCGLGWLPVDLLNKDYRSFLTFYYCVLPAFGSLKNPNLNTLPSIISSTGLCMHL